MKTGTVVTIVVGVAAVGGLIWYLNKTKAPQPNIVINQAAPDSGGGMVRGPETNPYDTANAFLGFATATVGALAPGLNAALENAMKDKPKAPEKDSDTGVERV